MSYLEIKGNNKSYKQQIENRDCSSATTESQSWASSEIRWNDRTGVMPHHILYLIMKILRMRIVDGVRSSFRCARNVENVTRKETEHPAFINECVEKNFAFLKSVPNSLPPILHILVFERNERELRVTSRNKRELRVISRNKRELRVTSRNKRESRVT
ncbi:hypothetical protein AVEN_36081-1 [Araneus ventricosus]|uniref:Uncharacterized protein n=1 Tax=Araneus ventricosus TaxID=182803 RepID=A0A4Y2JZW7_ARAVE|nr:hypothetical protein AVEN_36081-1 [Araneus ventricosus]